MALNTITDGPSMMQLMLAIFDEKPPAMHGVRTVSFVLRNFGRLTAHLTSAEHPNPESPDEERGLWIFRSDTTSLPTGYYYSERNALELHYDPYNRIGYVDLELMCPNCGFTKFDKSEQAGIATRTCQKCDHVVMRREPGGKWEWQDPEVRRQHLQYCRSLVVETIADTPYEL